MKRRARRLCCGGQRLWTTSRRGGLRGSAHDSDLPPAALASTRLRPTPRSWIDLQPTATYAYTHQRWPAPCSFSRSSPWRRPSRRSPGMRRSARRRPSRWPRLRSPSRSMLFPSCRRSSSPSRRAAASPAPRGRVAGALRARAPAATPRRGETGAARTEFDGGNISGDDGRVPRRPPRHLLPHVLPRHALHPVRGVQRASPRPPFARARADAAGPFFEPCVPSQAANPDEDF